ncbi:MAG TPA: DEAD/DEAH box helicase [Polyangiaceae bacterium]|nr:DEAD/DEAH box helicase [Polyangiaceae bacterium]
MPPLLPYANGPLQDDVSVLAQSLNPPNGLPEPTYMERLVLAALALRGRSRISGLLATASVLGASESTPSLKHALEPYLAAGWVLETSEGYECTWGLGPRVLRSFPPAELTALGNAYVESLRRSYGGGLSLLEGSVKLGLAGGDFEWEQALDQLTATGASPLWAPQHLQEPLLGAFDRGWFGKFSESQQQRLARLLLEWCEAKAQPLDLFEEYAADPSSVVQTDLELRSYWARLQLLRGGAASLPKAQVDAFAPLSGVPFMWHVVSGDFGGARRALDSAIERKRLALLPGVAGVLEVLVLLRGEAPGDLEQAARLASSGARKGNLFRESFGTLKRLLACHYGGSHLWVDVHQGGSGEADALRALIGGLCAAWFKELEPDVPYAFMAAQRRLDHLARGTWLSAQYRDITTNLASRVPQDALAQKLLWGQQATELRRAVEFALSAEPVTFPPLRYLFAAKAPWEAALGRLEALAQQAPSGAEPASAERIVWRVSRQEIEPYLQRRTPNGWTRGRKLAVKHLLPGADQRATLPPEDLRVAEHARESMSEQSYGYRDVFHSIEQSAWNALIGHPRVFWEESEHASEVVRGALQLVAQEAGDQFTLTVQPDDLSEHDFVRREGERLVVYPTDKAALRVLEVVGRGLKVPSAQRERLLAAAAGVTHLIPLQSNVAPSVDAKPGEATPCLRLAPRGEGLVVTLRVRPLGERGPALAPGAGATVLFAHVDGVAAQAIRDLALEVERAGAVVAACPVLDGREAGDNEWFLEAPEPCLELLASLSSLGDQVRVEWPHGKPVTLRARLGRESLRGRLRRVGAAFFLDASFELTDGLELSLSELLRLSLGQGRFVRLEQGDFVELSTELRDQLAAIAAARGEAADPASNEIALPQTAFGALEALMSQASKHIVLDAPAVKWRDEFAKVFDSKPRLPRGLNAELRDYQVDGFRWLARLGELGFGACLADDMGLGKTVQLIALLLHRVRSGPALVVAPTSVCENWLRELARFAPSLSVTNYAGPGRESLLEGLRARAVVVAGYATLQQDAEALQAIEWGTVILDEAQFIKNASAQRTRAALSLRAGMRIAATGTPVENHAEDLYSLFQFVQPGLLGSAASFRRRFPLSEDSARARDSRRQLRRLVQPFLLRRTKPQVLAELPPITEIEHQVELSREEAQLYEAVRLAALDKLGDGEGNKIVMLAELTRLRRLCCDARLVAPETKIESSKLKALLELMRELTESGHRALIFSQFVDVLKLAASALEQSGVSYQYLDGSCTPKQRTAAVDAFQAGNGEAFLISLKAGGFGLNLTAADYVIHLDPWWNPATESQATDRAHRIGQQNPVTLYRLVARGTIEERIVALHRSKRDLADSLLAESDKAAALSSAEIRALLEK